MTRRPFDPVNVILLLACVAVALLLNDYDGIMHDAALYTFQALARLHPEALAHDVALRFGSQDDYTVFSWLYAPLIGWFGVENAALGVTVASQALLFVALWCLGRALFGPRLGALAVLVALALPNGYGAARVFGYFEMFATPRIAGEAFALLAVAAFVSRRTVGAIAALTVAMALHPIVSLPAVGVIGVLALERWKPASASARRLAVLAAALIGVGALLTFVLAKMDDAWFALVSERAPYLFVTRWTLDDWALLAPHAATLLIGLRLASASPIRSLLVATTWTLITGLAASWLLADLLHSRLGIEVQYWRVTWLASLVATFALPWLATSSPRDARSWVALALLACAWVADATIVTLIFSVLAALVAYAPPAPARFSPWIERLAWLVFVAISALAIWNFSRFPFGLFAESTVSPTINTLRNLALLPLTGALFAGAVYWAASRATTRNARFALAGLFVVVVLALLPPVVSDWTQSRIPQPVYAAFGKWRDRIPPKSEVFCGDDARTCWFLLERASYMSATQSSGALFSREAAFEMDRRAAELAPLTDPSVLMSWTPHGVNRGDLAGACRGSGVDFMVMPAAAEFTDATGTKIAPLDTLRNLSLFDCARLR